MRLDCGCVLGADYQFRACSSKHRAIIERMVQDREKFVGAAPVAPLPRFRRDGRGHIGKLVAPGPLVFR